MTGARIGLPGALLLSRDAGMVDVQVETRAGITYLEIVVAIPMDRKAADDLASRLRSNSGRDAEITSLAAQSAGPTGRRRRRTG